MVKRELTRLAPVPVYAPLALAVLGCLGGSAQAQESDSALDEITVTGTRIRRDDYTSVTATQNITAEDMQRLGLVSAADMLAQLPSNVGTFQLDLDGTASQFFVGSTLANLRGMNTAQGTRTLVLVDGRRQVQTTAGGGVDLSFVPSILISRMETVTGGASAVYGSDASAGVVNIILDRNVTGLRLDASYGQNKNGDFRNYSVSVASGINNLLDGRGSLTVSYERQVTDPVASCGEVLEWCAKSAALLQNARGQQLYQINPNTGARTPCGGFFQFPCTQIIPEENRLFDDPNLPHNIFFEGMRLLHSSRNGSIHAPGPRRPDPAGTTAATRPLGPLQGLDIEGAGTFYEFNQEGTELIPYQEGLTDFWREYAWEGSGRRVQGGDGPLLTFGQPTRNGQERDNLFANFRWEVNENVTLNTRLTYGVTTGEQIRNSPQNLQDTVCVYLPQRPTTTGTTTATPDDDYLFDPDSLAIPDVNAPATGDPGYDGNPLYAGHFFQQLAFTGNPRYPDGTPLPAFFRNMGPANGFLDPRAPNPVSEEALQILLDRAQTYATLRTAPGPFAPIATVNGVPQDAGGLVDPNNYTNCAPNQGAFGVFQARHGINMQKNIGDWVDQRVFTDTDQMSLGFSADGPLFGGDKWTWDASLQYGESAQEQLRTQRQRNYRYMMAIDSVYDPEANGGAGGVVCRVNASDVVGGRDTRELYRNYILGLSSLDVYISEQGGIQNTTINVVNPDGTTSTQTIAQPVVVPQSLLDQGMEQVDLLREGCVPLNPFGQGYQTGNEADKARQIAAINFAYSDQVLLQDSEQLNASFSVSGEIWKGFGAGPIRMAAGLDYRDNATQSRNQSVGGGAPIVRTDFNGTGIDAWGNDPWNGLTEAYEIFNEFELPLIRDRLGARSLSINLTGRRTLNKQSRKTVSEASTFVDAANNDFSSKRYGTSWRASLNWSMTDYLRLRATRSADIRAPSSQELFNASTSQAGGFGAVQGRPNPWRDPTGAGGSSTQTEDPYGRIRGGNEALQNEMNETRSLGVVVMPGGVAEGLSLSFDYSEITVKGGITYLNDPVANFQGGGNAVAGADDEDVLNLNNVPYAIARCYLENDPFWCDKVIFNPAGSPDEPNSEGLDPYRDCEAEQPCVARTDIVAYVDTPFNAEPYWTRNLDISASYNLQLDGGGSLSMRLLATKALEQSRCVQVERTADGRSAICVERRNVVGVTGGGGGTPGYTNFTSQPTWAGNLYASYSKNAFTITGQARYTGKGLQSLDAIGPDHPDYDPFRYNSWVEQNLPSWTTFNLTTSYNFARSRFAPERFENLQVSLTIDNLFDKQPDFYSCGRCTGAVNTRFYGGNGRTFRVNFRSAF